MTRNRTFSLAVLSVVACLLGMAGEQARAKQEDLVKVTLKSETEFGVIPIYCLGADVVNLAGRGEVCKEGTKQLTVDCMPGTSFWLLGKDVSNGDHDLPCFILTITPEDNDKAIELKFEDRVCYKNGVPCSIDFSTRKESANVPGLMKLLERVKEAGKTKELTVMLDWDEDGLTVLKELKGKSAGINIEKSPDLKKVANEKLQEFARVIGEVDVRRLTIVIEGFNLLKDRLDKLESLSLIQDPLQPETIPDLARLVHCDF